MREVLLVVHLIGVALWIGGGALLAPWSARARRTLQPSLVEFAAETTTWLLERAILPAMVLTIASGVGLTVVAGLAARPPAWLIAKAALAVLGVVVLWTGQRPSGQALVAALRASSRKASAQVPHLVRRQQRWGMISGVLALAALALAVFKP
ncbi:MAG: DUF2269 family protein [Armatimonadota bacterium]|nr:DUF2269 family protein [Armatimonadota bacterium]